MDVGAAAVSSVGRDVVASRHALYSSSGSLSYTRGGSVNQANSQLVRCYRNFVERTLREGEEVVFACQLKVTTYFFVLIKSSRSAGKRTEAAAFVVSSETRSDEDGNVDTPQVLLGLPIFATLALEFRGRGAFGLSFARSLNSKDTLYFETQSMHSMWSAIVMIEKLRDEGGPPDESSFQWMADYFPRAPSSGTTISSPAVSPRDASEPEEEGEGGTTVSVDEDRRVPSSDAQTEKYVNALWEIRPGFALERFSLRALRSNRTASLAVLRKGTYSKPSVDELSECVMDIVSKASDPDALSMDDVLIELKETFGEEVVGRFGYSSAMIDKLVYKAYGQLEPPSLIIDGVFLGSEYNAANRAELVQLGVTHVLNVTVEVDKFFPDDFKYHQVCILDRPTSAIAPYFERALEFIEWGVRSGGAVLVHCQRGVSRSASFVVAYVMKTKRMTADEAIVFVKERRRIVKPNAGFVRQLREYEKELGV